MSTVSHSIAAPRYAPLSPRTEPAPNRQKREAPPPEPHAMSPRQQGDSELAGLYGQVLARTTGVPSHDNTLMLDNIPRDSTFGQWWAQLGRAFASPQVVQWMRESHINPATVKINPVTGQISFEYARYLGKPGVHTRGLDDPQWSKVSGPVLAAARVVGGHTYRSYTPPMNENSTTAPLWLVGRFYFEDEGLGRAGTQQRAIQLQQNKGFPVLDPANFSWAINSRSEAELEDQKAMTGNLHTRTTAAQLLRHFVNFLKESVRTDDQILDYLTTTKVNIHPDSTYSRLHVDKWNDVSLKQFLDDNGLDIPTNQAELENLATALSRPEPESPPNGNYGGALDWPEPLDPVSQRQLRADIRQGTFGNIDLSPFKNVLEYLLQHAQVYPAQMRNPRLLIDSLILSPKGKALGEAIQAKFEARGVKGSASDWLLAALSADQNDTVIGSPTALKVQKNAWVAGYQLSSRANEGKPASKVVNELAEHLVKTGGASSPERATIQAYLLLSSRAPEFLVKDIPDNVVQGTHSWVSFVTAVERIEAKAPGATASMSYGQVMLEADVAPVSAAERQVEYEAQTAALRDWGSANGMGFALTDTQMDEVRKAYNAHIQELQAASEAQNTPVPDAREMALEQLKKALPQMDPALFDKKCINLETSHPDFPGPYSILDLYMDERTLNGSTPGAQHRGVSINGELQSHVIKNYWVSSSREINIDNILGKLKDLPRISTLFEKAFSDYCAQAEKSAATQVKLLISRLPLADRENLEFGKITVVKEWNNDYSAFSRVKTSQPAASGGNLLVKTELDGKIHTYEIDLKHNKITERKDLGDFQPGDHPPDTREPGKTLREVIPSGTYTRGLTDEKTFGRASPHSFSSERTAYIADAMVKDIDIAAQKKQLKGTTTFDTEVPFYKIAHEFMLNLIPLRSAIKNFANGNIGEGIVDLGMDVFGFAVGLGAAAKGGKAIQAGASALSKLGQGAKIVGRAVIGALNPLGGIDDLARGVVNQGRKAIGAARSGYTRLRGVLTHVDPVALAKKPNIAQGTLKAANSAEEVKVFAKFDDATGNWHALNLKTKQPYGKPLEKFIPDNVSVETLSGQVQKLYKSLNEPAQACFDNAIMVSQANNALPLKTRNTLLANLKGQPSNYTPRYKEIMGVSPTTTSGVFDPTAIKESGFINFISKKEDGRMVHTAYIQKTADNKLFIYNTNQIVLDRELLKATGQINHLGGAFVFSLDNDGLQKFLDTGYEFVFTPNSTINANVQRLTA